ncbi:MAG: DUF3566 domain-containing protein [Nocardioidaceae bacterium]
MSNPRDNEPLAPRRSLSKAGATSGSTPAPGTPAAPTPFGTAQREAADTPAQRKVADKAGPETASAAAAARADRDFADLRADRDFVDAPTQPVMTPPYGGNPQPYSVAEVDKGRTFPVPPAPVEQGDHRAAVPPAVDKRAERRAAASRPRTVRRAKLRLMRVDPWSVTKASLLLSIAFGIMCVVSVFLIFSIMSAAGLWDHINATIQGVLNQDQADAFDIKDYVGMSRVMGITMLISAIDVVLITALATLGAFIYNMSASLLGGIEVTLAEDVK